MTNKPRVRLNRMRGILFLTVTALASAQITPKFEVAVIKPSQPITQQMLQAGLPIGMKVTSNRVNFGFVALRGLVMLAFDVKSFQVSAPDYTDQRFDIAAVLPDGATEKDVPALLRRLLEERFHMKARTEQREQPMFTLLPTSAGVRFKAIPDDGPEGLHRTQGASEMRVVWDRIAWSKYVDMLSETLGAPVIDRTGLDGFYPLFMDLGTNGGPLIGVLTDSLEQQGLRLDRQKAPADFIVVESIDRMPTEN